MRKKNTVSAFALVLVFMTSLLIAPVSSQPQRGPRIDTLRYRVVTDPLAQMIIGPPTGCDVWSSLAGPADVDDLEAYSENDVILPGAIEAMVNVGIEIAWGPGLHKGYFCFNYRCHPLGDVNFRHALAHLLDKVRLLAMHFQYTAVTDDSMVPATMCEWINSEVDQHPYDPEEAQSILIASGYTYDPGIDNWRDPNGIPIPPLQVCTPTFESAPTSWIFGVTWVDEMHAIGLNSFLHTPMSFQYYLRSVYDNWNFDICWVGESFGRWPDYVYDIAHSSQNYQGSCNPTGINWAELDTQLEILKFSFDHVARVEACRLAQEMLQGGSIDNPLPAPAPPSLLQALPYIPVYTKNYFSALQPQLNGMINAFGWGVDNMWTHSNMYWNTPGEFRPGTNLREVWWIVHESPETLNPASAKTVYAWAFMDPVFDGLIAVNPWTLRDIPWLATEWIMADYNGPMNHYVDGMYVTFTLRTIDPLMQPITWQDGTPISPWDVFFAWQFIRYWAIPKYLSFSAHITNIIINGDDITAYFDTTSQWFIYDLARTALMFPPQVWDRAWTSLEEILAFDPSAEPGWNGVTPTNLFGTGPFILQHSTEFINLNRYGDLDANRDYWLPTPEIQDRITDMFHGAGDVNYDGEIRALDLARIGLAMGTYPGHPYWDPDADICGPMGTPPEGYINIYDMATCGRFYGETREV